MFHERLLNQSWLGALVLLTTKHTIDKITLGRAVLPFETTRPRGSSIHYSQLSLLFTRGV